MQLYSTRQRNTFFGLSPTEVIVLGRDGNLWLEKGPWGANPPARTQIDGDVAAFRPISDSEVYVLGHDGKLWFETGPFGPVPPARQQVDGNVVAFEPLDDHQCLVLGSDGNLWYENGPWGKSVPPARQWVDGNVADFQSNGSNEVFVLGNNGNLWNEPAPFGTRNPIRRALVDTDITAFQVIDSTHVVVQTNSEAMYLDNGPWPMAAGSRQQVLADTATFQILSGGQLFATTHQGRMYEIVYPRGGLIADVMQKEVDANVYGFQMLGEEQGYVLGSDGTLWLESGPWGTAPPTRQKVDGNVGYIPYFAPLPISFPPAPVSLTFYPNLDGLNGNVTLTLSSSGACEFKGSFSPSNAVTGILSYDVSVAVIVRDRTGVGYGFTAQGTVGSESSYNWDQSATNEIVAKNWSNIVPGYSWHWDANANVDLQVTINSIVSAYQQIDQVIGEVVEVIGPLVAAA